MTQSKLEKTLEKLEGKKIYKWEELDKKTHLYWDSKTSRYEFIFSRSGEVELIEIYTRGKKLIASATPERIEGIVIGAFHYGYDRIKLLEKYLGWN